MLFYVTTREEMKRNRRVSASLIHPHILVMFKHYSENERLEQLNYFFLASVSRIEHNWSLQQMESCFQLEVFVRDFTASMLN